MTKREEIVEILKDHELLRTDGVHVVMIKGIFPEIYEKLTDTILTKLLPSEEEIYKVWKKHKISTGDGMSDVMDLYKFRQAITSLIKGT